MEAARTTKADKSTLRIGGRHNQVSAQCLSSHESEPGNLVGHELCSQHADEVTGVEVELLRRRVLELA